MARKFTLYWSSLDRYEKCPRSFLWGRGWGTIDVGGGPGRRKPEPFKSSRHHAVMGIVIQSVVEHLYNDELWRDPAGLSERLVRMVEREWDREVANPRNYIDYRIAGHKSELLKICKDGVKGYLRTMKANRLLGEYSRAEVELLGWVDKWNPVGGRADLIIRRQDSGVSILDGKNSKSKGRYTDPDQLRWYAMLFYLAYRELPSRLGFVYYRYPHGAAILDDKGVDTGQAETGVDWVEFTRDDLKGLAHRAVVVRKGMEKEKFDANPVPNNCKWCDYESVCDQRIAQKKKNSRKKPKSVEVLEGAKGFVDFSM